MLTRLGLALGRQENLKKSEDLNKQLKALEHSLKVLKEAP